MHIGFSIFLHQITHPQPQTPPCARPSIPPWHTPLTSVVFALIVIIETLGYFGLHMLLDSTCPVSVLLVTGINAKFGFASVL